MSDHIVAHHRAAAFSRAQANTLSREALEVGASRLGVTPDVLVTLADRCTAQVLGSQRSADLGVAEGSTAFICGLLQALELVERSGSATTSLRRAIRIVVRRGRQTVIATHCDLTAVSRAEQEIGSLILSTSTASLEGHVHTRLVGALHHMFELGLAIGLATSVP